MGWGAGESKDDDGSSGGALAPPLDVNGIGSENEIETFNVLSLPDAGQQTVRVEGLDLTDRDGVLVLVFPGDNVFAAPKVFIPQLGLMGEGRVQQAQGIVFNAIRLARLKASYPTMKGMFEKAHE